MVAVLLVATLRTGLGKIFSLSPERHRQTRSVSTYFHIQTSTFNLTLGVWCTQPQEVQTNDTIYTGGGTHRGQGYLGCMNMQQPAHTTPMYKVE